MFARKLKRDVRLINICDVLVDASVISGRKKMAHPDLMSKPRRPRASGAVDVVGELR